MVRTIGSQKRRWLRGLPLGALLLGAAVATVGLGGRAIGVVVTTPIAKTPDTTTDGTVDPARPPVPIRPGCCLPVLPQAPEVVCRADMTATECQAAGGRLVRSCLYCGLSLVPESNETQAAE